MGNLKDRYQKRFEDKGKGGKRERVLDFKGKEVTFWKPKNNKNKISILPYTITSKLHPLVRSKDADIGEEDFLLDLWVHRYVGEAKVDILCPKRSLGKPCPICEQKDIFMERGRKDDAYKCNPSHRAFYNIIDENDREKGVQIFEESYANFQDELIKDAADTEDGEIVQYANWKNGKAISFRAEQTSFGSGKFFEYRSFKFLSRDPLDKSLKENILNLDAYIVVKSYEDIKAIYYGEDVDSEDEDEEDTKKKHGKKAQVEEEEDEEEEEEDEPKKGKGKAKKEEEDEDEDEDEEPEPKKGKGKKESKPPVEDDEDDEDEDEEEAPKAKKGKGKAKVEEEEEDDDEPEPEPKKGKGKAKKEVDPDDVPFDEDSTLKAAKKAVESKKESSKEKCPHGHTFGVDTDKFNECEDCKSWEDCYKTKKANKAKK